MGREGEKEREERGEKEKEREGGRREGEGEMGRIEGRRRVGEKEGREGGESRRKPWLGSSIVHNVHNVFILLMSVLDWDNQGQVIRQSGEGVDVTGRRCQT